jgi:hypothetical protein
VQPVPAATQAQIVYLLPEGCEADGLAAALRNGGRPRGLHEVKPEGQGVIAAFAGLYEDQASRIEVRPRTATVIADVFAVRRDLLVHVMDLVADAG